VSVRPSLARSDVVLVSFPFTDLTGQKLRPALVIGRPSGDDLIVAFISSRVGAIDAHTEVLLEPGDPEFADSGLRVPSLVRLGKIATLHRRLVQRRLGQIGPRTKAAVARSLRYVFDV
jgi:mRNA interferase MazF